MNTVAIDPGQEWGFPAYMEKQSALELARRSVLGAPVYVLISLIIFIGTPIFMEYGWWAVAEAGLLVLLGVVRVWFAITFKQRYEQLGERAVLQFNILTALQSLTLGVLAAVVIYKYWASQDVVLTIVLSAGCVAAGTSALSVRRSAHFIFLACVLVPLGVSLFLVGGLPKALLVIGFLLLMAFLVQDGGLARRTNTQHMKDHYNVQVSRHRMTVESQAKTEFLTGLGQRVRKPVNSIIGMNINLRELDLDKKSHRITKSIAASTKELLDLVDEFPSLVDSEIGLVNDDLFEGSMGLHQCAYSVVEMYQPEASEKGLELISRLDGLPQANVKFDHDHLSQILANLLSNAVKFTKKGSVVLGATCKEPADGTQIIEFSLSDTGVGIPAGQLKNIFNPFSPSGAKSSAKYGGTGGLGLPLCKGLVELVNGEIWIKSKKGKGTTVKFTFPVKPVVVEA